MKKYSKEEKGMWLEDWRKSGKSVWAYAKENSLNPQTFSNWTKEGHETKTRFVEVPSTALQTADQKHEIIIEKGDVKIRIPVIIGCRELRAVMEGLGAVL